MASLGLLRAYPFRDVSRPKRIYLVFVIPRGLAPGLLLQSNRMISLRSAPTSPQPGSREHRRSRPADRGCVLGADAGGRGSLPRNETANEGSRMGATARYLKRKGSRCVSVAT